MLFWKDCFRAVEINSKLAGTADILIAMCLDPRFKIRYCNVGKKEDPNTMAAMQGKLHMSRDNHLMLEAKIIRRHIKPYMHYMFQTNPIL